MRTTVLVANSYTGELFPVDKYVIKKVLRNKKNAETFKWLDGIQNNTNGVVKKIMFYEPYWSKRFQTIYDMLMAGF